MTEIQINDDILCKTLEMNGVIYLRFSNPRSGAPVFAGSETVETLHTCLKRQLENAPDTVAGNLELGALKRDRSAAPIQFTIKGKLLGKESLALGWVEGAINAAVEAGLDTEKLPKPETKSDAQPKGTGRIDGQKMKRAFDMGLENTELMKYLEYPMIVAFMLNADLLPKGATQEDLREEAKSFIKANGITWQDANSLPAAINLMMAQAEQFRASERASVVSR